MAFNCSMVSSGASASALAARRIFRLSASDGIAMTRLGVVFDIVLDLTTFGVAQADDATNLVSVNEGDVVQTVALWNKADHAHLIVVEAFIKPHKSLIPGEFLGEG
jgi:hypothetical protein